MRIDSGNRKNLTLFTAAMLAAVPLCLAGCRRASPPHPAAGAPQAARDSAAEKASSEDKSTAAATAPKGEQPAQASRDAASTNVAAATSPELGKQLYNRHCAGCHGERGDGKGVGAAFVFPKPRDFRAGRFRLVSTANNVPSADDLQAVLQRGMPGSSMPPWAHLSPVERTALVEHIRQFRSEGAREQYIAVLKEQDELTDAELAADDVQAEIRDYVHRFTTPGDSTAVPEIPSPTADALARGKDVYAKNGCLQCHGEQGKGDGVQKMFDDEKLPTSPRDFTQGIFKGGHDPASLYRRIAYGMPGTPMPGSQQMTPEQMIDLVQYVRSLSTEEQRQAAILNREKVVARKVAVSPTTADAAEWSDVPATVLRMTPLWWRNDADPDFRVQVVHDGKTLAVRISWRDATSNQNSARTEAFRDAVAMELFGGGDAPFLGMGGPDSPVDVWFWDADRQGERLTVEELYPNTVVDLYPFSETVVTTAELDRPGARTADQPDISLPARASGNPNTPTGHDASASSLTVGGPGSVTFRLPQSQLVTATGQWQDGRWTVVMTRSLSVATPDDGVSLELGQPASLAFAVWDGAHRDRDGAKVISIWQDLELEP